MEEGAASERDPVELGGGGGGERALARHSVGEGKERGRAPRVSEGEGEGSERASEGEGVRASGAGAGRLGRRWPAPGPLVGCARRWLGRLAWLAPGAFSSFFFELERKKKIIVFEKINGCS